MSESPCVKCKKTMSEEWLKEHCTTDCWQRKLWEIDKHEKNNEALAKVCSNLNDKIERLERERGEQKQKLEQIISGFNGWWRLYRGDLDSSGRLDFRANLKSLEDLLKE